MIFTKKRFFYLIFLFLFNPGNVAYSGSSDPSPVSVGGNLSFGYPFLHSPEGTSKNLVGIFSSSQGLILDLDPIYFLGATVELNYTSRFFNSNLGNKDFYILIATNIGLPVLARFSFPSPTPKQRTYITAGVLNEIMWSVWKSTPGDGRALPTYDLQAGKEFQRFVFYAVIGFGKEIEWNSKIKIPLEIRYEEGLSSILKNENIKARNLWFRISILYDLF